MNTYPLGAQVYLPIDLKVLGQPIQAAPADLQIHLVTEDQVTSSFTLLLGQVQPGLQGVIDTSQVASFFYVYTTVKAGVVGYTWYAYPGKVPVLEGKFAVSPPLAA